MKKIFLQMLAMLPFILVQCTTAEPEQDNPEPGQEPDEPVEETVTLTLNAGKIQPASKTSAGLDGNIVWNDEDVVYINGKQYGVVPDAEDRSVATVQGVRQSDGYVAFTGSDVQKSGDNYLFDIAPEQKYVTDAIDGGYLPMAAYSAEKTLEFYNISAVLRVGLTGEGTISGMTLVSNDGIPVAGRMEVPTGDVKDSDYKDIYGIVAGESASDKVGLSGLSADLSSSVKWFHFAIAPGRYAGGFTLYIEGSEGEIMLMNIRKSIDAARSAVSDLGTFPFEPVEAPVVSDIEEGETSVSYSVSGQPGMRLGTAIVLQSDWDALTSEKERSEYAQRALSAWQEAPVEINAEGKVRFDDIDSALDRDMNAQALAPGTGYVILAVYFDKGEPFGPYGQSAFTTPALPEEPELAVDLEPGVYYNELVYTIRAEGASNVKYRLLHIFDYEEYTQNGATDETLVDGGTDLSGEDLEAAVSEGYSGYLRRNDIFASNEYIILAKATFPDGTDAISTDRAVTREHFSSDAEWKVVSTDAEMSLESYSWSGLTVEKIAGLGIYRIASPLNKDEEFRAYMASLGYGIDDNPDGTYYIYIDVMDQDYPDKPYIMPYESYIGFTSPDDSEYPGTAVYISNRQSHYWSGYENNSGRISIYANVRFSCGIQQYGWMGEDELSNDYYLSVRFTGELYQEGGMSNEDFVIGDEVGWK